MFLVDVNASAYHEVCDQVEVRAEVEEALELLLMDSQRGSRNAGWLFFSWEGHVCQKKA